LSAFSVDLYLSADETDVRKAVESGIAAAVIYPTAKEVNPSEEIRIAFDGDAVLFSDEADRIYREEGPSAFFEHERLHAQDPLPAGPFGRLLRTLAILQNSPQFKRPPIRTALVTSRGMPAHLRVLYTLRAWNIEIDEAFFMGGVPKSGNGSKVERVDEAKPDVAVMLWSPQEVVFDLPHAMPGGDPDRRLQVSPGNRLAKEKSRVETTCVLMWFALMLYRVGHFKRNKMPCEPRIGVERIEHRRTPGNIPFYRVGHSDEADRAG
jgi:5'-nucleotidase